MFRLVLHFEVVINQEIFVQSLHLAVLVAVLCCYPVAIQLMTPQWRTSPPTPPSLARSHLLVQAKRRHRKAAVKVQDNKAEKEKKRKKSSGRRRAEEGGQGSQEGTVPCL